MATADQLNNLGLQNAVKSSLPARFFHEICAGMASFAYCSGTAVIGLNHSRCNSINLILRLRSTSRFLNGKIVKPALETARIVTDIFH